MLGWGDEVRRLGVRANADTVEDAPRARELGAEGIGLCRTEHMFFGRERERGGPRDVHRGRVRPPALGGGGGHGFTARGAARGDAAGGLRRDPEGDGRPAGDDPVARPADARVVCPRRPSRASSPRPRSEATPTQWRTPETARGRTRAGRNKPDAWHAGRPAGPAPPALYEMQVRGRSPRRSREPAERGRSAGRRS